MSAESGSAAVTVPTAVPFSATENSTVPEASVVSPDVSNTGGSFTSVTATVTVA